MHGRVGRIVVGVPLTVVLNFQNSTRNFSRGIVDASGFNAEIGISTRAAASVSEALLSGVSPQSFAG